MMFSLLVRPADLYPKEMVLTNGLSTRIVDQFKDRKVFGANHNAVAFASMPPRGKDTHFKISTSRNKSRLP
jgi:hypothetical protein